MSRLGMSMLELIVTFCDRTYGETLAYPTTIELPPRAYDKLVTELGPRMVVEPSRDSDAVYGAIVLACGTHIKVSTDDRGQADK